MTTQNPDHILDDRDAARYVGLTAATLRASRLARPRCDGPPYIRMGRAVRYRVSDLDAWLDDRRVVPRVVRETVAG
jgi:predicted DNA-binding transcriptional regulator AlpA